MMREEYFYMIIGPTAHSIQQLATGSTTKGSEFESWWEQECSLLHVVQNGSGAHPASYPMGTEVFFPEDKAAGP
jgi:hypothetical protein